jgi:hypothetical protein
MRHLFLLPIILLTGCVTERIIDRPVPAVVPSLCVTECPYSTEKPATNGALLEQWHERGEALECFKVRMQCVLELTTNPNQNPVSPSR